MRTIVFQITRFSYEVKYQFGLEMYAYSLCFRLQGLAMK